MIKYIDVKKIYSHPDNPRKDLGDLKELSESIKATGILQNLTVVPWFSSITRAPADDNSMDDCYVAVIGHRRLAAAKLAGLDKVPCMIASMSQKDQVSTMLMENMQRNDLTVWEQAQGFQMMLDFGESVNDISDKTGFSEATVRRRVKLLELDQDKLKESVSRGATLLDYAELEKIQNIKLRNSVLDKLGTSNFKYELQRAIDKEKSDIAMLKIISELEKFATKVKDSVGLKYVEYINPLQTHKFTIPADAGEVEYFYIVSGSCISLYKKQSESNNPSSNKDYQEEQRKRQERHKALEEIAARAYQLRKNFITNLTGLKKRSADIMEFMIRVLTNGYPSFDDDVFLEFLGVELNEDEDEEINFDAHVANLYKAALERIILITAYCYSRDSNNASYYDWNNHFRKNEDIDLLYHSLIKLGYEMSDEEISLQNGTHELFIGKEN